MFRVKYWFGIPVREAAVFNSIIGIIAAPIVILAIIFILCLFKDLILKAIKELANMIYSISGLSIDMEGIAIAYIAGMR